MTGVSSAVQTQTMASFLPIIVSEEEYSVGYRKFQRGATDPQLLAWTGEVLKSFTKLRQAINESKSLDLDKQVCQEQLVELAKWGGRTYRKFFDDEARQVLTSRFQMMGTETPAPTFISEKAPFPWDVLYKGDRYQDGDPEMFWGLGYSPARILTLGKDVSQHVREQTLPSDMLFCLHHYLRQTHEQEWPAIERLVRATRQDRFRLLGPLGGLTKIHDGEALLEYLDQANHNMLHFACHCQQYDAGSDALLVSLINDEGVEGDLPVIQLETYTFDDFEGHFQRQPLVFLNACQSAGGGDELRKEFSLPHAFIKRGAAAIIATACLVPDRFAAAFARQFYKFFLHGKEIIITDEQTGEERKQLRPMTIGEALTETRWYFLKEHNNPLGLAYGLYSPAYYRLAQPPATGGA